MEIGIGEMEIREAKGNRRETREKRDFLLQEQPF